MPNAVQFTEWFETSGPELLAAHVQPLYIYILDYIDRAESDSILKHMRNTLHSKTLTDQVKNVQPTHEAKASDLCLVRTSSKAHV